MYNSNPVRMAGRNVRLRGNAESYIAQSLRRASDFTVPFAGGRAVESCAGVPALAGDSSHPRLACGTPTAPGPVRLKPGLQRHHGMLSIRTGNWSPDWYFTSAAGRLTSASAVNSPRRSAEPNHSAGRTRSPSVVSRCAGPYVGRSFFAEIDPASGIGTNVGPGLPSP